MLAQRQVAYTDLDVHEICLPDPSCVVRDSTQTYHAVMVYCDIVSYGQVTCYDQRGLTQELMNARVWPAALEDARTNERHGFADLARLCAFLREQIVAWNDEARRSRSRRREISRWRTDALDPSAEVVLIRSDQYVAKEFAHADP